MAWKYLVSSFSKAFRARMHPPKSVPESMLPFQRKAWKPRVEDGDGAPLDSKFAGTPWLVSDEDWPCCRHCGKAMPLFLQLNLATLPDALDNEFGGGLLQLFYCINSEPLCEAECEAFFPFSKSQLVRIVQPDDEGREIEHPLFDRPFPPKQIVGWKEAEDYPNWEEGREHEIELSDEEWEWLAEKDLPSAADKLAGWPHWVQGIEYPHCPECQSPMRLVFQIDSNDHVPYMFGDLGCGHITQCPGHKHQVAFGWACS